VQVVPLHDFPVLILFQGLGYPYPGRTAGTEDENRVNYRETNEQLVESLFEFGSDEDEDAG